MPAQPKNWEAAANRSGKLRMDHFKTNINPMLSSLVHIRIVRVQLTRPLCLFEDYFQYM